MRISIHALREEGDGNPCPALSGSLHFYPRPPRGGRRGGSCLMISGVAFLSTPSARRATSRPLEHGSNVVFLSTPSARRATGFSLSRFKYYRHFYPRPPRGGRLGRYRVSSVNRRISIHALREEGDTIGDVYDVGNGIFLSTPSARRATGRKHKALVVVLISIHALREEGDLRNCGGEAAGKAFLSTPSARRATVDLPEGWDNETYFYPRPPRGGRPLAPDFF